MAQPLKEANQGLKENILAWLNEREYFLLQDLRRAFGAYTCNPNDYRVSTQIQAVCLLLKANGVIEFDKKINRLAQYRRTRVARMSDLRRFQVGMDPSCAPPKDIANAIHGACYDYRNIELEFSVINSETIQQRIYNTWQMIHHLVLQDPDGFIALVKARKPDLSYWEKVNDKEP